MAGHRQHAASVDSPEERSRGMVAIAIHSLTRAPYKVTFPAHVTIDGRTGDSNDARLPTDGCTQTIVFVFTAVTKTGPSALPWTYRSTNTVNPVAVIEYERRGHRRKRKEHVAVTCCVAEYARRELQQARRKRSV
jgi:hypothetical protein